MPCTATWSCKICWHCSPNLWHHNGKYQWRPLEIYSKSKWRHLSFMASPWRWRHKLWRHHFLFISVLGGRGSFSLQFILFYFFEFSPFFSPWGKSTMPDSKKSADLRSSAYSKVEELEEWRGRQHLLSEFTDILRFWILLSLFSKFKKDFTVHNFIIILLQNLFLFVLLFQIGP